MPGSSWVVSRLAVEVRATYEYVSAAFDGGVGHPGNRYM